MMMKYVVVALIALFASTEAYHHNSHRRSILAKEHVKVAMSGLIGGIDEMKAALDSLKAAQDTINADNQSGLNETPEQALADAKAALDAIIADHEVNNANKVASQTADYVGSATAPILSFRALAKGIDEMKAALDTLKAAQDSINGDNNLANETPEQALADAKAALDAIIAEHEVNNANKVASQTAEYVGSATAPVLSFNRRALARGIDDMKASLDTLHAAQDAINADNPSGLNDAPEQALADAQATLDAIIAEHEVNNTNKIAQQTADYVTSTAFAHIADTFDVLESSTYALESNLRRANIV